MNPDKYEAELITKVRKMLRMSTFALESIAHLRGREARMLPLANALKAVNRELSNPDGDSHVFVLARADAIKVLEVVEAQANACRTGDEAMHWNRLVNEISGGKS